MVRLLLLTWHVLISTIGLINFLYGVLQTFKDNFVKVKKFAMIKALRDTMVFPNEGEWWGHYADGSQKEVLKMRDTKWYQEDLFGLKTVDEVRGTTLSVHCCSVDAQNFSLCCLCNCYLIGWQDCVQHDQRRTPPIQE